MGKIIGMAIGLIIALIFIIFGFFKGLFIILCITAGYFIGKVYDNNKEDFYEFLNKILPKKF